MGEQMKAQMVLVTNGPGHMTKMAAMSIYGKNKKTKKQKKQQQKTNLLLRNQKADDLES